MITKAQLEAWAAKTFSDPAELRGALAVCEQLWPVLEAATLTEVCAHPMCTVETGRDFCPDCNKFINIAERGQPPKLTKALVDVEGITK